MIKLLKNKKIFFVCFMLCSSLNAQEKQPYTKTEVFGVAFLKSMFPNVALNDASAAIKVYLGELQRNTMIGFELKPVMFEDNEELLRSYSKENMALVSISSVDFLLNRSRLAITPIMVNSTKDSPYEEYILVVKKNGRINSIADLAEQKIGMLSRNYNPLPHMWLEIQMQKNKVVSQDKNFAGISEGKSESQIIMSVFFGQLNACLVTKNAFDLMAELNPQIGMQMKVLAKSPGFVRSVSSFTNKFMKTTFHKNLEEGIWKVASYPAGRQLFTLMRTDKVIPYKEEYMDGVKNLLSEYKLLQKKTKN
ncbi:MAG: PhnD/SsuA/transferrin family substrate-binding protein [Syntrophothermus sp.]